MSREQRIFAICLVVLIVSLLLVGIVSSTLIRHILQLIPAVLALVVVARRTTWADYAALPIFVLWLLIMLAIWLFLLGLARVVTGTFSASEIVLTVLIGISSIGGIANGVRSPWRATIGKRLAAFVCVAILQVGAVWLSIQQPFANR